MFEVINNVPNLFVNQLITRFSPFIVPNNFIL